MKHQILIYGANGYTGRLLARYAKQYNIVPVLAGRNETAIRSLAEELQFPYVIFSLDDEEILKKQLEQVLIVIHAAGPFKETAKQMVETCINTHTHYLDINGDISVFEFIKQYDAAAKNARIMLMPGTGFDVVPTDCMALQLKELLPDATDLKLAFVPMGGSLSHGTATTMASKLGEGGAARINGKIANKPLGQHSMWLQFENKKRFVMSIPWGDVSTAYFTTGIPNIETYTGVTPLTYRLLKFQFLLNWLLRTNWMRGIIQNKINAAPAGPTDEQRANGSTYIWGKASNKKGDAVIRKFVCADGYTFTVLATLHIVKKMIDGAYKPGYQTPAAVYGPNLAFEIEGTRTID